MTDSVTTVASVRIVGATSALQRRSSHRSNLTKSPPGLALTDRDQPGRHRPFGAQDAPRRLVHPLDGAHHFDAVAEHVDPSLEVREVRMQVLLGVDEVLDDSLGGPFT